MRSRSAVWFECKIRYEKVMEDGLQKKVNENYVVDALSFSEAEKRIIEEMSSYISGEFEVADIKKAAYKEIFFTDDNIADKWYKAKLQFITIDEKEMKAYQAKAEQIFRKQFTKEADRILNKVYNKKEMNLNEKDFMARSRSMTEELAKAESELAKQANLGNEKSQRIASEIIDQLTTKKMEALDKDYLGIKKNKTEKK